MVRGGISSSGFGVGLDVVDGVSMGEDEEDMMEREEGGSVWSGGRYCEEKGDRMGVFELELRVEAGRTRFARRKVKNAISMC